MFGFDARRSAGARGRVLHHRAGKGSLIVASFGGAMQRAVVLSWQARVHV